MDIFTILIIEDDDQINDALAIYLKKEGYLTIQAFNGKEALDKFILNRIDLIILDVMLPMIDGKEVLRQIRSTSEVPVIMLTALGKEYDKLLGFELGADDYITKPFSLKEIAARVNAVLKRAMKVESIKNEYLCIGRIRINPITRQVFINEQEVKEVSLTRKEFDLLYIMANNPNMAFSRERLLEIVWDNRDICDSRTVDTHIKQLREKLCSAKEYIQTIWGIGYKLQVRENEAADVK